MTSEAGDGLDQTQYLVRSRLYDDPATPPVPLDLHSAAAIGNYECVQEAINSGQDIDARNKAGWTPLMYAAYVGHDTIVNLLLDSHANPSLGTPTGLTPLMVAAGCGNESVCYFLIQAEAEVDARDEHGLSALSNAVRQGHQTVVHLLLVEAGADIELKESKKGRTALMLAAVDGDEIVVDILIACRASLEAVDNDGYTARHLAYQNNHVRTVALLDNARFAYGESKEPPSVFEDGAESDEEASDIFFGAEEMAAYQRSLVVRKSIQFNLGFRSGPQSSLLPEHSAREMARRRGSAPISDPLGVGKHKLKAAAMMPQMSMPERMNPPLIVEQLIADGVGGEGVRDEQVEALLSGLGLEKYAELFQRQEIDYDSLLSCTDEDLKRVGMNLLGPRRKLSRLLAEMREKNSPKSRGVATNSGRGSKGGGRGAQLVKQSSTEVTTAYRQALEQIEYLEQQLTQEHELRKSADSYLLEIQLSRQQASSCVQGVRDGYNDIAKHTKSVRTTQGRLSDEVQCLRLLASSAALQPQEMTKIHSEVITLTARMGMELEALHRSVKLAAQHTETLAYHLDASSYDAKLIVLGSANVGKTCLLQRYLTGNFTETISSIGASLALKKWDDWTVALWDTAGEERYASLSSFYCRGASVAILAFDLTNSASLEKLQSVFIPLLEDSVESCLTFVVGTKLDLASSERKVKTSEGRKVAEEQLTRQTERALQTNSSSFLQNIKPNNLYFETSSKMGDGVTELFDQIQKIIVPQLEIMFAGQNRNRSAKSAKADRSIRLDGTDGGGRSRNSGGGCCGSD